MPNDEVNQPQRDAARSERVTADQPVDARRESERLSDALRLPPDAVQNPSAPRLTGYVLTQLLGEGGFGQVWKAWQLETTKPVAVKVFFRRSGMDWLFLRREVERLVRLDAHPRIITLLGANLEGEPPSYVMELMTLGTLRQRAAQTPVPSTDRVLRWLDQILDALSYVHGKGLIHCDLKPDNILLDDQDNIRVTDFGQSRVFTEASGALGTLLFMAPEQAAITKEGVPAQPDVRWDIYALGASVYSLLVGHPPHASQESDRRLLEAGDLTERLQVYRKIVGADPQPLRAELVARGTDRELREIVLKCIAADPAQRYGSIHAIQTDLSARKSGGVISPLAHDRSYRLRRFALRHRMGLAVAAAMLLAAIGGSAWWRTRLRYRAEEVEGFVDRGIAASQRGDTDRAESYYADALRLDANHPRALGNLCILRKDMLDAVAASAPSASAEALALCDRALAVNRSEVYAPRLWNARGTWCKRLGNLDGAIESYARAIEHVGTGDERDYELEVDALTNLGVAYALKGDVASAERRLREAVDLDAELVPHQCHSTRDLGALELALRRSNAGETLARALKCFENAGATDEPLDGLPSPRACQDAWTYLLLARERLNREGNVDATAAVTDLTRADVLARSAIPQVKRTLAWAHLRGERFADAIHEAEAALKRGDDPPTASHYIIAIAAAKSGQRELAETEVKAATASWPAELSTPGSAKFTAPKGNLWFEAERELEAFRAEAGRVMK